MVWPPGQLLGAARDAARRPPRCRASTARGAAPLLAEFPRDHDYRAIVDVPARFASHAVDLPEFAVARLHGAWTRGVSRLADGEDELVDFLVERVRAHGGEARLAERAARVVHKRGRVSGVVVDGDDDADGRRASS